MNYATIPSDPYANEKLEATKLGAESFERLLLVAEGREDEIGLLASERDAAIVASFISDLAGDISFQFIDLRPLEHDLDGDIIRVIDFIRWGKESLFDSVPDGLSRSRAVVEEWSEELRQRKFPIKVVRAID